MLKLFFLLSIIFAFSTAAMACTAGGMYCTSDKACCSHTCLKADDAKSGICKSRSRKKECGPGAEKVECSLGHCQTGVCVLSCHSDDDCGRGKCGFVDGPDNSGTCVVPRCLEKKHCKAKSAICDPSNWKCNSSDQSCNTNTDCNENPLIQTHFCVPQREGKTCQDCLYGGCDPNGEECDTALDCGSDPKNPSYKCVPQYPDDMPFNPTVCKPCEGEDDPECKPADSLPSSDQVLLVQEYGQ